MQILLETRKGNSAVNALCLHKVRRPEADAFLVGLLTRKYGMKLEHGLDDLVEYLQDKCIPFDLFAVSGSFTRGYRRMPAGGGA